MRTSGVGAGAAADRQTEEEVCYVTAERRQGGSLLERTPRGIRFNMVSRATDLRMCVEDGHW